MKKCNNGDMKNNDVDEKMKNVYISEEDMCRIKEVAMHSETQGDAFTNIFLLGVEKGLEIA